MKSPSIGRSTVSSVDQQSIAPDEHDSRTASASGSSRAARNRHTSVASLNTELRDKIAEHLTLRSLADLRATGRLFQTTKNYARTDYVLTKRRKLWLLLKTNPNLQRLTITDPELTDSDLQWLQRWQFELSIGLQPDQPKNDLALTELTIRGATHITDAGLLALSTLTSPRCVRLDLRECGSITGTGLGHLANLSGLQELHLDGQLLRGNDLRHLRKMSKLTTLSLQELYAHGLMLFSNLEPLTSLRRLEINFSLQKGSLAEADTGRFESLNNLKALEELQYSANNIEEDGEWVSDDDIMHIGNSSGLTKLMISVCGTDASALEHLGRLTNLRHLQLIEVDSPPTELQWEWLRRLPKLESFKLDHCIVDDSTLSPLAAMTTLKTVMVNDQLYFPESLFENLPLSLESLDIGESQITPDALRLLQRFPALSSLKMDACFADHMAEEKCDDAVLEPLSDMPQIKTIDISHCGFSDDAIAKLRAVPGRTIITDTPEI